MKKNYDKDIYNVTKDLYFRKMLFFCTLYSSKKPEKNLLSSFQHDNNNKCFKQQIRMISEGSCDWGNNAKNSALKSEGLQILF